MKNRLKKTVISYLILVSLLFSFAGLSATALQGPSLVAGVAYYIRNVHSGLYLDVDHAGTTSGTNVIQYNLTGDPNQKWTIHSLENGYYVIRPMHASGLALDVIDGGTSSNVGVWNVGTANSSSIPTSSQWKLYHATNSGGVIFKSRCSNEEMVLEVYYSSMENCGNVTQYYYTADDNRNDEWILEPIHGFTGNAVTTWSHSSQAISPNGSQEHLFVPQRGNMWLDFYNSYPQKVVKSTIDMWFTQDNIDEIIAINEGIRGWYFDVDVTSHREDVDDLSEMSAYAIVTNIPNPKIDIENDKGQDEDTDDNYEESEVGCMSSRSLVADQKYIVATYWFDYRNGDNTDDGHFTTTFEMALKLGGEIYGLRSSKYTPKLFYGINGGYR